LHPLLSAATNEIRAGCRERLHAMLQGKTLETDIESNEMIFGEEDGDIELPL
jgi:hypothetical protein